MKTRFILLQLALAAAVLAGLAVFALPSNLVQASSSNRAPRFVVDPDWPKPLPNQWLVGQVAGVAVDRHDNIWIIQRPSTLTVDEAGGSADAAPLGMLLSRALRHAV